MKHASRRAKGQDGERSAASDLAVLWPLARRGLGQARDGSDVPDVDGTPLFVEVKRQKTLNLWAAFKQATDAAKKSKRQWLAPIVIAKRDHDREWLVTMGFNLFISFFGGDMLSKGIKETIRKVVESHTLSVLDTPFELSAIALERHAKTITVTSDALWEAVLQARSGGISEVMQQLHKTAIDHETLDIAYDVTKGDKW